MYSEEATKEIDNKLFIEKLYEDFERLMYFTAQKYIADTYRCEDVVQECLSKLIEHVGVLRTLDRPALASYIVVTVRNTSINFLKKEAHENDKKATLVKAKETALEPITASVEEYIIKKENRIHFWEIMQSLDLETKCLLDAKYILGYDDKELSIVAGCSPNSVRMKLTRARRKVLKILNEEGATLD